MFIDKIFNLFGRRKGPNKKELSNKIEEAWNARAYKDIFFYGQMMYEHGIHDSYTVFIWAMSASQHCSDEQYSKESLLQAVDIYEKTIELGLSYVSLYFDLADAYYKLAEIDKNLSLYQKAIETITQQTTIDPNEPMWLSHLAKYQISYAIASQNKDLEKQAFETAKMAVDRYAKKDYSKENSQYEDFDFEDSLEDNLEDDLYLLALSFELTLNKIEDISLHHQLHDLLDYMLSKVSDSPTLCSQRAQTLITIAKFDNNIDTYNAAFELYEKASLLDPKEVYYLEALAMNMIMAEIRTKDKSFTAKLSSILEKVVRLGTENKYLLNKWIEYILNEYQSNKKKGLLDENIRLLNKTLEVSPDNKQLLMLKAYCYTEMAEQTNDIEKHKVACLAYEKLIEDSADDFVTLFSHLENLYHIANLENDAKGLNQVYQKCKTLGNKFPKEEAVYGLMAEALIQLSKREGSIQKHKNEIEKLLIRSGELSKEEPMLVFARLYCLANETDKAFEWLEKEIEHAIRNDISDLSDIFDEGDLENLKKDPRFDELLKKHKIK